MRRANLDLVVLASVLILAGYTAAAAQGPPGPFQVQRGADVVGAPVTPSVFTGDLRQLPTARPWHPGDPVRFVPRRYYRDYQDPRKNVVDRSRPTPDPLLEVQENARPAPSGRIANDIELEFAGQGFTGVHPPDTNGDVGFDYYIQMVNHPDGSILTIYDKADGAVIAGPLTVDNLGSGDCATGRGDPIVLYDRMADRWLISEFADRVVGDALCVYVSQTSDPVTGGWYNYEFQTPNFPDYPKYAVWHDAYYVTSNEMQGPAVYALDRENMLDGNPARPFQRFTAGRLGGFGFEALIPADADGATGPPTGAPALFARHRDDEAHNPGANDPFNDFIELFELELDWLTPANSTFSGPMNVEVTEFDSDLCGLSGISCFSQPGSVIRLDPLREVVMWRLQYRNFGSHETLVGNFVTDVNGTDRGGIRWFELRKTGALPWSLHQEGTYSPNDDNRWMASAAMDGEGNIAVGYNVTSSSVAPGLRYAGRMAEDPLNSLPRGEYSLIAGTSANEFERYGDYSSISVDPGDDLTFWFTGEYNTSLNWSTRVAAFRLGGDKPAIRFESPATGTVFPQVSIPLVLHAGDDEAILGVEIEVLDQNSQTVVFITAGFSGICTDPLIPNCEIWTADWDASLVNPGPYTVKATVSDFTGNDATAEISLTIDDDPIDISGLVWNDEDANGIYDPATESGRPGQRVWIDLGGTPVETLTQSDGTYSLQVASSTPAGNYTLHQDLEAGWQLTFPPGGVHVLAFNGTPGQSFPDKNFGDYCNDPACQAAGVTISEIFIDNPGGNGNWTTPTGWQILTNYKNKFGQWAIAFANTPLYNVDLQVGDTLEVRAIENWVFGDPNSEVLWATFDHWGDGSKDGDFIGYDYREVLITSPNQVIESYYRGARKLQFEDNIGNVAPIYLEDEGRLVQASTQTQYQRPFGHSFGLSYQVKVVSGDETFVLSGLEFHNGSQWVPISQPFTIDRNKWPDGSPSPGPDELIRVRGVYEPLPVVADLIPGHGTKNGGTPVLIRGAHFSSPPVTSVTFGGVEARGFITVSDTEIWAFSPPGGSKRSVRVTNARGTSPDTAADNFTYLYPMRGILVLWAEPPMAADLGPSGIAAADLDGDGKLDLATADQFGGAFNEGVVTVFRNTSPGGPTATFDTSSFPTTDLNGEGGEPFWVAAGDLDADGRTDLVTLNTYGQFSALLNTTVAGQPISFAPPVVAYASCGFVPAGLAIADVDLDGKPELVTATTVNFDYANVVPNLTPAPGGPLQFGTTQCFYVDQSIPTDVAVADFDGDAKPELVVSNWGGGVSVFHNASAAPGDITFDYPVNFALGAVLGLAVADFTRDGKLDIAASYPLGEEIRILENTSSEQLTFSTWGPFSAPAGHEPRYVSLADINEDGKLDLVSVNGIPSGPPVDGKMVVWLNRTAGGTVDFQSTSSYEAGDRPLDVTFGDFNGDGRPGEAIVDPDNNQIRVYTSRRVNAIE